jgi:glucose-6-phosphate-specific signal transduction histidine kinase
MPTILKLGLLYDIALKRSDPSGIIFWCLLLVPTLVSIAIGFIPLFDPGIMDISIQDNGRGFNFNPETLGSATGGLGLMNLFNRVNLVGGTAKVNSAPGKGTQIHLHIPL